MKNNPILLLLVYLLLIFVILFFFSLWGVHRILDSQNSFSQNLSIYSDHPVSYPIAVHHNGLSTIYIFLKNTAIQNRDPFVFTLSENDKIIRQIDINGSNIGDGDNVRFQFSPILDSVNKTYTITLTAPHTRYSQAITTNLSYESYYTPLSKTEILKSLNLTFFSRLSLPLLLSWAITSFVLYQLVIWGLKKV